MKGFVGNIEEMVEHNADFRHVTYTGKKLQLVLMSLKPGEEIGEELHPDHDQFFRIEKGKGVVTIDGHRTEIKGDFGVLVPAGSKHNIKNTGDREMKLYTLYGPPQHEDGTVQVTKADAISSKEHFAGHTTE
ncbi:MAG TPA: cupin domain-containing protein [Candidatus Eisenbacteria bacterium]|nr:cupin domain-containing protein [Candidatus Eisenbacteria bacterium]